MIQLVKKPKSCASCGEHFDGRTMTINERSFFVCYECHFSELYELIKGYQKVIRASGIAKTLSNANLDLGEASSTLKKDDSH